MYISEYRRQNQIRNPNVQEDRKNNHWKLRLLIAVPGVLILAFFLLQFLLPQHTASEIRNWIGLADSPETVAVKMISACRDKNFKTVSDLLSEDSRSFLFTRAALSDPQVPQEEALERFIGDLPEKLKGAVFKAERDPLVSAEDSGRIRVFVGVYLPKKQPEQVPADAAPGDSSAEAETEAEPKPDFRIPVEEVREKTGWKCDSLF